MIQITHRLCIYASILSNVKPHTTGWELKKLIERFLIGYLDFHFVASFLTFQAEGQHHPLSPPPPQLYRMGISRNVG